MLGWSLPALLPNIAAVQQLLLMLANLAPGSTVHSGAEPKGLI